MKSDLQDTSYQDADDGDGDADADALPDADADEDADTDEDADNDTDDDADAANSDGQCNAPPSIAVIGRQWQDNVHISSQPSV